MLGAGVSLTLLPAIETFFSPIELLFSTLIMRAFCLVLMTPVLSCLVLFLKCLYEEI